MRFLLLVSLVGSCILLPLGLLPQELTINEVMSSNSSTIQDEDGEYPDWIELFNGEDEAIDLGGYGLSDEQDRPFQWIFPSILIPAKGHLLIYASDKDRRTSYHWETIIDWGDEWTYRVGTSEPPSSWRTAQFDDSSWLSGPSGFGYGDNDDATVITSALSIYIRKEFDIQQFDAVAAAYLHVDYDDAFVAYLNGLEVARANIGQVGVPPPFNQGADTYVEARIYQGYPPRAFEVASAPTLLQPSGNVLAIQVHNTHTGSSDLSLIPFFTLGYSEVPDNPAGTPDILSLSPGNLHTNFKMKSGGETLVLTSPSDSLIDHVETGVIPQDVSFGRLPDGGSSWVLFQHPTPGASNIDEGFEGIVDEPRCSHPGGFFTDPFVLSLTVETPGAAVYYTTDGADPDQSSTPYTGPIPVDRTMVIRARAFRNGWLPSQTVTHTLFMNEPVTLPIVSLSTDPAHLWDEDDGIYAMGRSASPEFPHFGANFWEDWERPIHLEFYETGGSVDLSIDAGVKIYGGWSRGFAQKSLAIYARSIYGQREIVYPLFPERPFDEYEAIVLRNSGNDWESTMLRDGFLVTLGLQIGLDGQAYRPVAVFLNGQYWGLHNLREKINEHFIASHHNLDPDSIDLLENQGVALHGDSDHYDAMMAFINTHDLSVQAHYDQIQTMMDVENYILYQLTQIYTDNRDWPGNNLKYWRPRRADGKWRWILFDTDFGFGIWDPNAYAYNTLAFAAEPNGPAWPNPPWSTLLFRKLLDNETFRTAFIHTFCDHLNTTFQSDRIVARLSEFRAAIAPEMPRQLEKWNNIFDWDANIERIETFASYRVGFLRAHLRSFFNLYGMTLIHLNIAPAGGGRIQFNSISISEFPWQGYYFKNLPITISAHPADGFRFAGWSGLDQADSSSITVLITEDMSITAAFESIDGHGSLVINEINYNSSSNFDPEDWFELYNAYTSAVDLGGWMCMDSEDDHIFTIPENTVLEPGAYIVICRDTTAFKIHFPEAKHFIGNLSYGFSGSGDCVRLFDQNGAIIDSVMYDDTEPWPLTPDGDGPTLELINPNFDNTLQENWEASSNHGTPGAINSVFSCDRMPDGDVNDDGDVTITDVVLTIHVLLGREGFTLDQRCKADMNQDGNINILDVLPMIHIILNP